MSGLGGSDDFGPGNTSLNPPPPTQMRFSRKNTLSRRNSSHENTFAFSSDTEGAEPGERVISRVGSRSGHSALVRSSSSGYLDEDVLQLTPAHVINRSPETIDSLLAHAGGFGKFQIRLLWLCSTCFFAAGVNMLMPAVLIPRLEELFGVSELQADLISSVFFLGYCLGLPFWAAIADTRGRRRAVLIAFLVMTVPGIAMFANASNFTFLLICRAISGFGTCGVFNGTLVLALEFMDSSKRALCKGVFSCCWSLSLLFTSLITYQLRRQPWGFLVLLQFPSILSLMLVRTILPESPRYFTVAGNLRLAIGQVIVIAEINGVALPFDVMDALNYPHAYVTTNSSAQVADGDEPSMGRPSGSTRSIASSGGGFTAGNTDSLSKEERVHPEPGTFSMWHAFSSLFSRALWLSTITVCLSQFVGTGSYYAIAFATHLMPGASVYLAAVLGALVEVPTHITMVLFANTFGRRTTLIGYFCVIALCGVIMSFVSLSQSLERAFTLIARMAALGASTLTYVYAAELVPSTSRNFGVALASLCGHAGPILAPFLMNSGFGLIVIAVLSAISVASLLFVRETRGYTLADVPETPEQPRSQEEEDLGERA
ncbi:putative transporter svop-1 [Porphyridium purpureum]|uniref:Putative transporter svop-1 n=1 Tax=Porphyridium purpureum TaxID=35688 RepID=A0A5J4Z1B8_PORPP|nr:putative transporter svop-1 [Porphyridium purpureum]|eukprot:POR3739..scf208_2